MDLMHEAKVLLGKALRPIHAGEEKLVSHQPRVASMRTIKVESDAFENNHAIPVKYSAEGANVSPPLRWENVPEGTREIILICEDPDAPFRRPFLHWTMVGISPVAGALPEGVPAVTVPDLPIGAVQIQNSAHKLGYYGPIPPPGHGPHHYHFQVFA